MNIMKMESMVANIVDTMDKEKNVMRSEKEAVELTLSDYQKAKVRLNCQVCYKSTFLMIGLN